MALQLARRTRIVVLMVPTWPESGFREGVARLRGRGLAGRRGRQLALPGGLGRRGRGPGIGRPGTGIRD